MSSEEARVAQAVASLTTALEGEGIEDSTRKAHDFIHGMLRDGWRPRAREVWVPPATRSGERTDPKPWADQIRADLRASTPAPEDLADRTQEDAHE